MGKRRERPELRIVGHYMMIEGKQVEIDPIKTPELWQQLRDRCKQVFAEILLNKIEQLTQNNEVEAPDLDIPNPTIPPIVIPEVKSAMKIKYEDLPDICSVRVVAQYLGLSKDTVYELCQRSPSIGGIPSYMIGGSRKIDRDDMLKWKEARRQEGLSRWDANATN